MEVSDNLQRLIEKTKVTGVRSSRSTSKYPLNRSIRPEIKSKSPKQKETFNKTFTKIGNSNNIKMVKQPSIKSKNSKVVDEVDEIEFKDDDEISNRAKSLERDLSRSNTLKDYKKHDNEKYKNIKKYEKNQANRILISVEGSEQGEIAFDVMAKELLNINSSVIMSYIYDSLNDKDFNYSNKKATVIGKYETKGISINSKIFMKEELKLPHFIQQVLKHAKSFSSQFLITSNMGLRGPRSNSKLFIEAVRYLLLECPIPIFIIQEKTHRNRKHKKGLKWLFLMDRNNFKCKKILQVFLPFVDQNIDYVHGVTIMPNYMYYDDLEEEFRYEMNHYGISNYDYDNIINPNESFAKLSCSFVNHGKTNYDFVVFYHNQEKYYYFREQNDSLYFIMKMKANLCFTP